MPFDGSVATWLPLAIRFDPSTTFEQWQEEWEKIDRTDKAIQWIIGDTLVYGEQRWGERFAAVLDPKYAEKHRGKMWLSKQISEEERREEFSYSFHRELGALDRDARDFWFDKAIAEGWDTVERLREERAIAKRLATSNSNDEPPLPLVGGENSPERVDDPEPVFVEPVQQPAPPPNGNRTEALRQLIIDVRECGEMGAVPDGLTWELADRMQEVLNLDIPAAVFDECGTAMGLRPEGWRTTIIERDDDTWEVRYRADGQKQAIAISPDLCCALVEAALAAELSSA